MAGEAFDLDGAGLRAVDIGVSRVGPVPDATLVQLARRTGLATIFTVDHSDFETYRIEGKHRFRIVPDR